MKLKFNKLNMPYKTLKLVQMFRPDGEIYAFRNVVNMEVTRAGVKLTVLERNVGKKLNTRKLKHYNYLRKDGFDRMLIGI